MSRAYRIKVSETMERVIHVEDGVASTLEILQVLPKERMKALLAAELEASGMEVKDGVATRVAESPDGDVTTSVEIETGKVSVKIEKREDVKVKVERERVWDTDWKDREAEAKKELRVAARDEFEEKIAAAAEEARKRASSRLESELASAKTSLDGVVHRVTAAALKEKAASMGEIEDVSENAEEGTLAIRVRV